MQETKQPNAILDLALTVILPSMTLEWLSGALWLGPAAPIWALGVASLIPLGYGIWCWWNDTGLNFLSVFGLVAIILTGGLGLLKLDTFWFAFKEASVPIILGLCFPLSFLWKKPLIESLLLQPQLMNVKLIRQAVADASRRVPWQKLLFNCSLAMGAVMLLSAALNFALAWWLLDGLSPQTAEHNSALSKLNWGGMLVIGLPMLGAMMLILVRFMKGLERVTGLDRNDFLNSGRTVTRQVGVGRDAGNV